MTTHARIASRTISFPWYAPVRIVVVLISADIDECAIAHINVRNHARGRLCPVCTLNPTPVLSAPPEENHSHYSYDNQRYDNDRNDRERIVLTCKGAISNKDKDLGKEGAHGVTETISM
jgi:hypothetical protein